MTCQIGLCYWILDNSTKTAKSPRQNHQAGEIQQISKHKTIWRWLHNNKNTTQSNSMLQREGTTLVTDPKLIRLHASPFLTQLQLQDRFQQGIPASTLQYIPLHSAGVRPLSLDGFWDTLNTHRWNSSLLWLERDFDPTRTSCENPTQWPRKAQHGPNSSTVSRLEQTCLHNSRQLLLMEPYNKTADMIKCQCYSGALQPFSSNKIHFTNKTSQTW